MKSNKSMHRLLTNVMQLPYCDLQLKRHDGKLKLVELTIRVLPENIGWLSSVVSNAAKNFDKPTN